MLVCESEENRRKLAWLVPGYILLAWFFCVVFQPLGFTTVPGRGNNNDFNDESLYEIINLQDDPQWKSRCESGERQRIVLTSGRGSGLILRLTSQEFYRYEEYNCSLEVVAGVGMDGITAVVEHMDLRGEEEEQWREPACPDYLDIRSGQALVRSPLCGQWDVERDHQLILSGTDRNIIGYCVEDRSGHSCETKNILVDVAIDHNRSLSDRFPGLRKSDRHGFTVVFTAWRHADSSGACLESELTCPNSDGGVHARREHCIWQNMLCDGHQNCGFLVNRDEWGCRLGRETPWSFGTITVLVTIWIAIVTILMLATVFLLQWNRLSLRTPLGMVADGRSEMGSGGSGGVVTQPPVTERLQGGQVMSTASAADPHTGGLVSIMVMYRPPPGTATAAAANVTAAKSLDQPPPTYESLFLGDSGQTTGDEERRVSNTSLQMEAADILRSAGDMAATTEQIRCERVPSNISEAIGLLRRVTSSHNAAEAAGQQQQQLEAGGSGQGEAVTMGLEATMVDVESLLLHCCHQEPLVATNPPASQQPPEEAADCPQKDNILTTSTLLDV